MWGASRTSEGTACRRCRRAWCGGLRREAAPPPHRHLCNGGGKEERGGCEGQATLIREELDADVV